MKNLARSSKIILLILTSLVLSSCEKEDVSITYDITGEWKVISYEDLQTAIVVKKTEENTWSQINHGDVTISFSQTDNKSGTFSGKKVTNAFFGEYEIEKSGLIGISKFGQTFINEPEWGILFDSFIHAESYQIKGSRLIILYNQENNKITLERVNN